MFAIDEELDVRGLYGPHPILRAKKRLEQLMVGQCLKVLTTGYNSMLDFEYFSKSTGVELVESTKCEDGLVIVLKKTH